MFGKFKEFREDKSRETRAPVIAWAHEQGWYVADPPAPSLQFPPHLLAPRMRSLVCNLVVGDLRQQGFTAQSWEGEISDLGGIAFNGRLHVLVTATRENLPRMAAAAKNELDMLTYYVPKDLAGGPLVKAGPLAHMGGDAEAVHRLAPLATAIAEADAWLVLTPGSVSFHGNGEPDLDQLQMRMQLSRDIAVAFGAQLG